MTTPVEQLAAQIAALQRQVRNMGVGPQLAYSAIEDGAIQEYDAADSLVQIIGQQFDGTHMAAPVNGPVPPQMSAPIVTPVSGGLLVSWDGNWALALSAPMNFARGEVHVTTDIAETTFDTAATLRATIETPRGADVFIPLDTQVPHYVALVARNLAGQRSTATAPVAGTPLPVTAKNLILTDIDGNPITNLADGLPNFVQIVDSATGETMATISEDGTITGVTGSFDTLSIDGKDYATEIDWQRPWGLQAWGVDSSTPSTTTEIGWFEVAFEAVEGRHYEIGTNTVLVNKTGPGTYGIRMRANGASSPTISSQLIAYSYGVSAAPTGQGQLLRVHARRTIRCSASGFATTPGEFIAPGTNRLLVCLYTTGGEALTPHGTFWGELAINDIGPTVMDVGYANAGGGGQTAGKKRYVSYWDAVWSQTYKSDNSKNTVSGDDAYQGYAQSGGNGNQRSMIGFTGNAYSGETTKTIQQALSGATIERVQVYLYFYHWYNNAGGTAVLGKHTQSTEPATWSGTDDLKRVGAWPKPGGKWVDITSTITGWASTTRGIVLGPGVSTAAAYYGKAYGASVALAKRPKICITYTR